ncbi:hypothetical protein HMPREF3016_10500 [Rothia sp. HMSC065D02]|nr:hypothetical protein HMPREF3016_10500 [Rothia sp. HMSC065D02]
MLITYFKIKDVKLIRYSEVSPGSTEHSPSVDPKEILSQEENVQSYKIRLKREDPQKSGEHFKKEPYKRLIPRFSFRGNNGL